MRNILTAALLVLAGTGAALADTATVQAPAPVQTIQTPDVEYPSQAGPYTVIYREWSDLAG
ncbi:MAG: hypothetical protein JWM77_2162 [Rhodospirillales bacterium]|jgi:hypothetical protein|nr:hypothetical protein [Rhodospirillales bacterium]